MNLLLDQKEILIDLLKQKLNFHNSKIKIAESKRDVDNVILHHYYKALVVDMILQIEEDNK